MAEGLDEEEQERPVRELILIDRSIGKLVLLQEKLDLLVEKNDRLINKAMLKVKSEQLERRVDALLKELGNQRKQSTKMEEKIKYHIADL